MKFIPTLLAISTLALSVPAIAQQSEPKEEQSGIASVSHALSKSVDPQVLGQLMSQMMNPAAFMANPAASCSACHKADDVARYEKALGPFLKFMMNPANWMSADAYQQMAAPVVDPATYKEWYKAYSRKMGSFSDRYK
ncbi:MAG: hypothetical protein LJE84_10750 [Gammaproteobacteria bacterium]|jgi:cytochrome c553|nr:hypothetical protein [Gammaproteobacteria bacterium]